MSITSIKRNFNGDPNIVTIISNNTLTELTTPGYLDQEDISSDILTLNNGPFEFQDSDIFLIKYQNGIGYFKRNNSDFSFNSISIAPPPNTMYTSDSSGNVVFAPFQENIPFTTTVSFTTPGDLFVVYVFRNGFYWRTGNEVDFYMTASFNPIFTTSSGDLTFTLPHTVATDLGGTITAAGGGSLTYPMGVTDLAARTNAGENKGVVLGFGDSFAGTTIKASDMVTTFTYNFSIKYRYTVS